MTKIQSIILWVLTLITGAIVLGNNSKEDQNNEKEKTTIEPGTEIFEGTDLRKVAGLKLTDGEDSTAVSIKDNNWGVEQKEHFPADLQKIRGAFDKLTKLKVVQGVPAAAEYWGRFGLDSEATKEDDRPREISITNDEGKVIQTIFIGKQRENTGGLRGNNAGRFVRFAGDDSGVYVVNEDFNFFDDNPDNWINKKFITISRPLEVKAEPAKGKAWTLARAKKSEDFAYTELMDKFQNTTENTNPLKNLFNGGNFTELLTEDEAKSKRADKKKRKMTVTTEDQSIYEFTLWPVKKDKKEDDKEKKEEEENPDYVITFKITGEPKAPADPGEKATEEEKAAFQAAMINFKSAPARAARNKAYEGRFYLVPNSLVKPLLVRRKDIFKAKPAPKPAAPVVPPTPAVPTEAPKVKATAVTKPIAVPPIPGTPLDPKKRIEAVTPPIAIPPMPKKAEAPKPPVKPKIEAPEIKVEAPETKIETPETKVDPPSGE